MSVCHAAYTGRLDKAAQQAELELDCQMSMCHIDCAGGAKGSSTEPAPTGAGKQ